VTDEVKSKRKEDDLTERYRLEERRSGGNQKREDESRRPYDRDYSRILHSPSFRRLQSKTQVLSVGYGDFYRTRLTHSLEVAQIGRGITHHLRDRERDFAFALPPRSLVEASALAHDLGHPPFGHYGERQLNLLMRDHGGFEGNGQTLRILTKLENGAESHGLDLTRRLLLAVLKYPVSITESLSQFPPKDKEVAPGESDRTRAHPRQGLTPPKGFLRTEDDLVAWLMEPFTDAERSWLRELAPPSKPGKLAKPKHRSLDTTIMELADDIAYGVHDLEDALRLEQVSKGQIEGSSHNLPKLLSEAFEGRAMSAEDVLRQLTGGNSRERKNAIGELVNLFVSSVQLVQNESPDGGKLTCPILTHRADLPQCQRSLLDGLTTFVWDELISRPVVQQIESRGAFIMAEVWEVLSGMSPDLLYGQHCERWKAASGNRTSEMRVLCDYIAGMTDSYITQLYERLFYPNHGSPFDVL
tara:strand:- start:10659 stop:12071 length:1413 start_codon:yes stop_codon:yes gene_type:complete